MLICVSLDCAAGGSGDLPLPQLDANVSSMSQIASLAMGSMDCQLPWCKPARKRRKQLLQVDA